MGLFWSNTHGLSQEKVAELVGVSRQAVTKWECDQSAPSTENLFKLAEIFGTSVDLLLDSNKRDSDTPADQISSLYMMEQEKKLVEKKKNLKKNILITLCILAGYLLFYLLGRHIWCDINDSNLVGWLFTSKPSGEHSYLYGWLLSSNLFIISIVVSAVPALFGKYKYAMTTAAGFIIGYLAGILLGPNPEGAAIGQGHYGWAIWGIIYFVSVVVGIIVEVIFKRTAKPTE